ncbi:MAG: hypothetical protein L0Y76_12005, partial [Ignavibacteria bacterium]|nr:hypothetical protein [Ignavibacteria bacterium]
DSTLTSSQYPVPPGLLTDNTQYFWRVYAKNSGGYSPASSVFSFTTLSVPPLIQIGIFNDGACLVFKAKSNVNITNRTVTKITFSVRYASTLNVNFQNPVSALGLSLGATSSTAGYNYRSYSTVQNTAINWTGEIEYEIMRVIISGNGTGVFELTNKIKNYNWYIELNGSNHTNTTLPFYVSSTESPLPVTLKSLIYEVKNSGVILKWETSREINNKGFDIERKISPDSVWSKIGFAEGKGNSNNIEKYTFEDKNLMPGKYNYRLKQIDYNGNYGYHIFSGEAVVRAPAKYSLSQNFPNPFNPVTSISFELPEKSFVTIKIYDITGKEVSVPVNEYKQAGRHEVRWDGSSLAS